MGLGFCGFVPKSTSSNFSLAVTYVSSPVVVFSSTTLLFSSSVSFKAIQRVRDLCLGPPPGPIVDCKWARAPS